ncbi:ABC-2 transporter permease [Paenibacillus sp. MBLB4367]|uniref:ABC-2 transporter permease n=1 Tax=Paenibacillus sp. MBLB4367 TaxID=3384767 RepID=UPI003907F062
MGPLILKDIRIQKRYILLGFVFIGIVFFGLGAFEGLPLSVPAAIFSHFLIVVASKSDEKNNNGRMLASFPLLRRDIVASKYAGIFVFIALAFALTSLWRVLAALILPSEELPWFDLPSVLLTIGVLLLFYSIYFPLFFALGSRLSQVLDIVVVFAVGGTAVIVLRILEWTNGGAGAALRELFAHGSAGMTAIGWWSAGGGLVLSIVSCLLAMALYERRSL